MGTSDDRFMDPCKAPGGFMGNIALSTEDRDYFEGERRRRDRLSSEKKTKKATETITQSRNETNYLQIVSGTSEDGASVDDDDDAEIVDDGDDSDKDGRRKKSGKVGRKRNWEKKAKKDKKNRRKESKLKRRQKKKERKSKKDKTESENNKPAEDEP